MIYMEDILAFVGEDLAQNPAPDPDEFEHLIGYLREESGLNDEVYSDVEAYLQLLPWGLPTLRRFLEAGERYYSRARAALRPLVDPENPTPEEHLAGGREVVSDFVVRKLRAHLEHYEGRPDLLRQDRINRWRRSGPEYILGHKFFAHSEFGRELAREHQTQT